MAKRCRAHNWTAHGPVIFIEEYNLKVWLGGRLCVDCGKADTQPQSQRIKGVGAPAREFAGVK